MGRAMDHHQPRDTEPQHSRRSNESSPQRARRVKPPVASKCDHDVSLHVRSVPARKPATDLRNHRHLKQAAAGSAQKTARRKDLSEQKYRHSTSQQFAVCSNDQVQRSGLFLLSNVPYSVYGRKLPVCAKSNGSRSPISGMFRSKIVTCAALSRSLLLADSALHFSKFVFYAVLSREGLIEKQQFPFRWTTNWSSKARRKAHFTGSGRISLEGTVPPPEFNSGYQLHRRLSPHSGALGARGGRLALPAA